MNEYEKEKYRILRMLESIKEELCLAQYTQALWKTIPLLEALKKISEKDLKHDN